MCFHIVEVTNENALSSYANSGVSKEESRKNPFYYPFQA